MNRGTPVIGTIFGTLKGEMSRAGKDSECFNDSHRWAGSDVARAGYRIGSADSRYRGRTSPVWNGGDGEAYARHLAPDAAFTKVFGMVMYVSSAFAKRHPETLATFYKGTIKDHEIRRIR